ncbi:uncharacterized protein PITG_13975 [Phytophthora infestans T30-4]|uniref:Uncharacterized protein n=1 Tax=Phytophthora infestans (strain T30-4) TaxID=403677 RepID=D0NN86_PHYIT|nr:uncharacterized protein PITG_13975 [Phytophthora infestans T30-4]EEY61993.1 hypothetical protein PITG_13975 [Phytophthora infestans T30-4]|eukprot:XP_002899633.1 hypothetical protein PITG_13975 [Phytophthora infestans T30-4]
MEQLQREYLRGARRKAQTSDYFDADDSADERDHSSAATPAVDDDEVDPLDAFMQGIATEVKQQRTAPPKLVADKPQVLNHADDDAHSYLEEYARVSFCF